MKDWIKKWYSRQFNDIDEEPSSEVWENISKDLDGWPKHWYRENAGDLHTSPRAATWDAINRSLTRGVLPKGSFLSRWAWFVLPVFFFIPHFLQRDSSTQKEVTTFSEFMREYEDNHSIARVEPTVNNFIKNGDQMEVVNHDLSRRDRTITNNNEIQTSSDENLALPKLLLENIEQEEELNHAEFNKNSAMQGGQFDSPVARLQPLIIKEDLLSSEKGWEILNIHDLSKHQTYLSINILPQLSWLDNTLTRTAREDNSSSVKSSASLGFAIALDQQIRDKHGVHIQTTLNNRKSVRVQHAESSTKNIDLSYHSLDVMYSYDWKELDALGGLTIQPRIGVFAGYLTNVKATSGNSRIQTLEEGFGKWDLGASFGLAFKKDLNKNWQLNTSLNNQWGTFNIFRGNQDIPANYFSTYAHAVQLSFGIARKL